MHTYPDLIPQLKHNMIQHRSQGVNFLISSYMILTRRSIQVNTAEEVHNAIRWLQNNNLAVRPPTTQGTKLLKVEPNYSSRSYSDSLPSEVLSSAKRLQQQG
jgi:hypothetical protein